MPSVRISAQTQTVFWAIIIAAFIGFVWVFQSILAPFVLGIVIAYLLNPVVLQIEKLGGPRWVGVLAILGLFFGLLILGLSLLIPVLIREIGQLSESVPVWIDHAQVYLADLGSRFGVDTSLPETGEIVGSLQDQAGQVLKAGKGVLIGLLAGGAAIAGFVTFIFLMPIVAFYMMVDWPRLTQKVNDLLPRSRAGDIRALLGQIDRTLAGFIRGQLSVCVILGLMYGIGLTLIGLRFGFVIGLSAGLLSIMPYVGSGLGLIGGSLVAWFTTGDINMVGLVVLVFVIGQVIEGNFLTPKLVGNNVGLHPLWIIFALMAGGALMGFVGLLIAVPVAAVIGVMVRFALQQYKKSEYY